MDQLGILGYFAEDQRLEREIRAYLDVLPADGSDLEVVLRPMAPDSHGADELASRVRLLRRMGIGLVSFYHYGLMRLAQRAMLDQGRGVRANVADEAAFVNDAVLTVDGGLLAGSYRMSRELQAE